MAQVAQSATPTQLWLALKAKLEVLPDLDDGRVVLVAQGPLPRYEADGFFLTVKIARFQPEQSSQAGALRVATIMAGQVWVWTYSRTLAGEAKDDSVLLTDSSVGLYGLGLLVTEALDGKYLFDAARGNADLIIEPLRLGVMDTVDQVKDNRYEGGLWPQVFHFRTVLPVTQNTDPS